MQKTKTKTKTMAMFAMALISGCTSADVDPVGDWTYSGSYGVGNCCLTGTNSGTITVSDGAQGFVLSSTAGAVSGSMTCSADACNITATLAPAATITVMLNLTLAEDGAVSGTGTTMMAQPTNCSQAFTVSGTKL